MEQANLQMERVRPSRELIDQARQVGLPDVPISLLLEEEEMSELVALELTLDAQQREQDRPRSDRTGHRGGRYWKLRFKD